jgi:hypothetical protein
MIVLDTNVVSENIEASTFRHGCALAGVPGIIERIYDRDYSG